MCLKVRLRSVSDLEFSYGECLEGDKHDCNRIQTVSDLEQAWESKDLAFPEWVNGWLRWVVKKVGAWRSRVHPSNESIWLNFAKWKQSGLIVSWMSSGPPRKIPRSGVESYGMALYFFYLIKINTCFYI